MKFTCDSCGSAYMIPDDKVGPAGVKVRCKKCGNVVTVRRPEAAPAPAPEPAPPPAAEQPQGGLDDELGAAFDHAFGGESRTRDRSQRRTRVRVHSGTLPQLALTGVV